MHGVAGPLTRAHPPEFIAASPLAVPRTSADGTEEVEDEAWPGPKLDDGSGDVELAVGQEGMQLAIRRTGKVGTRRFFLVSIWLTPAQAG
jgi:hypothetical protein